MTNQSEDSDPNLDSRSPTLRLFLDPQGDNFDELEKALLRSVKLIKIWWKGTDKSSRPLPNREESTRFAKTYDEQLGASPFPEPYMQLGPCIKALSGNMRFNKDNLMNVHPPPLLPAIVASLATSLQNPNNLSSSTSPATTAMERECIRELARVVGFPVRTGRAEAGGNIVSCGTLSNLTALMVAREKAYAKTERPPGKPWKDEGLFGAPRGIIVTSKSAHYSIRKASRILGLGDQGIIEVPIADKKELKDFEQSGAPLRLKPSRESYAEAFEGIRSATKDTGARRNTVISVVPTLGTISTGTIEPVKPLLDLRQEYGFHLHVDAAIGGLALGLSEVKRKASGVEAADSITIDPHKLGFVHYPCSLILFRMKSDLEYVAFDAPYIDSSARTIEGSRPGSSVAAFWVALKTLGKEGYNGIIGRCISLTRFLGKLLSDNGFQIPHEIDLNTLCFSLYKEHESRRKLNRLTSDLHSRVIADGRYLVGIVEDIPGIEVTDKPWQQNSEKVGLTGIKVWIMNPYTTEGDLEALTDVLNRKRKELAFN